MGANIGWLFYKDYFKDINYENINDKRNQSKIEEKIGNIINQTPTIEESKELGNIHFKATTTYPGLILGSGNSHELPSIEGQAILGFHFDYTSGFPVISGSSIKGVLRSAFKHWEYIAESTSLKTKEEVKALEEEIFDNADIFFDAEIIGADSFGKILGDDYLAPHGDNPLQSPTPLRFIKVLANVTFRFDFLLNNGIISKQSKSKLFQTILEDLGIGAKTNVGYGKFTNFNKHQTLEEKEVEKQEEKLRLELLKQKQEEELQKQREAKAQNEVEKKARIEAEKKEKEAQEKAKKEAFASQGIQKLLNDCIKFKVLESTIKKYIEINSLSQEEKEILENHILNNMNDKIKRKKFPFGTLGSDKCLGKDKANEIADKLGLK